MIKHDLAADHRDVAELRERGHDRRAARRRLDRDRDHVVDQQRDRGDLGHPWAEVLPRHHVRAAGPGVDGHDLAVEQHHQRDPEQDHAGHRQQDRESRRVAQDLHQLDQDFLRAVRSGRDPVAGQHAQRERLGQPLLGQLLVDQRRAKQAPLEGIPKALRQAGPRSSADQVSRLAHGHRFAPSRPRAADTGLHPRPGQPEFRPGCRAPGTRTAGLAAPRGCPWRRSRRSPAKPGLLLPRPFPRPCRGLPGSLLLGPAPHRRALLLALWSLTPTLSAAVRRIR